MRKRSYAFAFVLVSLILAFNIVTLRTPNWLVVRFEEIFKLKTTISYGLTHACSLTLGEIPDGEGGKATYRKYQCDPFPSPETDKWCNDENTGFCNEWRAARILHYVAIGFQAVTLLSIIFASSSQSRRRRIWRGVIGLVLLTAVFQIATFGLITSLYHDAQYPYFDRARPGVGYVLHSFAWISNILIALGIITTGLSADAGHEWAAGHRAYQPIA